MDVLLLMPGACSDSAAIVEVLRRRRAVSVSTDPACLDARCCILMVHAGARVEIVLDTGLAESLGLRFSSVFTMLVKRK